MHVQLETSRLILKPRTLDDFDDCMSMDQDPLVTQYIEGPWNNSEDHRTFLLNRLHRTYPKPFGYWSIFPIEDLNDFLGWVMIIPTDASPTCAEIGWRLTRKTWGKGIATEATKRVLERVCNAVPDIQLIASIHPQNTGSINVAEKIGLHFTKEEIIDGQLERFYALKT